MNFIQYNDIKVEYQFRDTFPGTPFFHQDFNRFGINPAINNSCWINNNSDSEFQMPNVQGYFHENLMLETPPIFPSEFILFCKGKFSLFEQSPALYCPCFGRQGLVIHEQLYEELFNNFTFGPHLKYSLQIHNKHKIFKNFILILFWHHGSDLIDWSQSLFIDRIDYRPNYSSIDKNKIFQFKSCEDFINRMNGIRAFIPLSLSYKYKYDIFFSVAAKANIMVSDKVLPWIKTRLNYSDFFVIYLGSDFETKKSTMN
ncbi:MAG: hypothetical protein R2787_05850 [Saprospiraceae bacterium]